MLRETSRRVRAGVILTERRFDDGIVNPRLVVEPVNGEGADAIAIDVRQEGNVVARIDRGGDVEFQIGFDVESAVDVDRLVHVKWIEIGRLGPKASDHVRARGEKNVGKNAPYSFVINNGIF